MSVRNSHISRMDRIILPSCAFLILVHLIASFFPQARLWGVNQLHYFPLGLRLALCAFGLLILIPRLNRFLVDLLTEALAPLARRLTKLNKYLLYSSISLLCLVPFWLLRAKTPLLGDGYLRAGELKLGSLLSITEPLDFYLHLFFFKLLGLDGYSTFAVLSCVAGALYVFFILLLCDLWGRGGKEKLFVFLIMTTLGAIQLFFGYIESYSFMFVLLTGYALLSLRYLQGLSGFVWPCLFLFLASGFHLSALSLLPSLVYLGLVRLPEHDRSRMAGGRLANAVLLVCLVSVMGLGLYILRTYSSEGTFGSFLIHPFGSGEGLYSFFSIAHLLDFINHQLLVSPIGLILCLGVLVWFRRRGSLGGAALKFLALVTACLFAFALLVDPKLGYARDWDLFASAGLGISLLGVYLLMSALRTERPATQTSAPLVTDLGRLTLALTVTSLVFTLPWLAINASEGKSTARFEDLLKIDEKRAAHGYETMACYFRDRGEHLQAARSWEGAIASNPLPRYFGALGNAYSRLKRYDQAAQAYGRSIQIEPRGPVAHMMHRSLGHSLAKMGRWDEAVDHLKQAIEFKPGQAEYHYALGNVLGAAGRYEEAVPYLQTALRMDPRNVTAYKNLGMIYARLGRKEEAKQYLEAYVKSMPKDAEGIEVMIDSIEIDIEYGR
jgi:tetratricopeptide (TPR) repeat protein